VKFSKQALSERMRKRFVMYTAAFATLLTVIFFLAGNELPENIDTFLVVVLGAPLFLGFIISIFGLFWEMAYGDDDPRQHMKEQS